MKKLAALLLLAAALYLFLPLGMLEVKKSPKILFFENIYGLLNIEEGRLEAEMKLKVPFASSVGIGVFNGKSTNLNLMLSSSFQKKSALFSALLNIKPAAAESGTGKPLTDLVAGDGKIYLNLHTLFDFMLTSRGEKLNYSLFFPADYIYFSFEDLASLSPEAVGILLISLSMQKCFSEPLSPLGKAVNNLLDDSCFSLTDGACVLTLDNNALQGIASALLSDISENSQEYVKLLIEKSSQGINEKSSSALAAEIKSWSTKALSSFSSMRDINANISVARIGSEKSYALGLLLSGEKENLLIDFGARIIPSEPEKITIPEKAMNAEDILKAPESSKIEL